jgi:hypothetical protein
MTLRTCRESTKNPLVVGGYHKPRSISTDTDIPYLIACELGLKSGIIHILWPTAVLYFREGMGMRARVRGKEGTASHVLDSRYI